MQGQKKTFGEPGRQRYLNKSSRLVVIRTVVLLQTLKGRKLQILCKVLPGPRLSRQLYTVQSWADVRISHFDRKLFS